ncbi:PaaI family thioesterase [Alsobacter sp. R-9]
MGQPSTGQRAMSEAELEAFFAREFPQIYVHGTIWHVEQLGHGTSRLRIDYHESQLRPGGTISGPTMFTLADLALYAAVLGAIGPVALAVTTSLTINFLRKPAAGPLWGECRLLKLGKRLAMGEVTILSELGGPAVAHATGTYSLPDR